MKKKIDNKITKVDAAMYHSYRTYILSTGVHCEKFFQMQNIAVVVGQHVKEIVSW